jgi:hypothetical protein
MCRPAWLNADGKGRSLMVPAGKGLVTIIMYGGNAHLKKIYKEIHKTINIL